MPEKSKDASSKKRLVKQGKGAGSAKLASSPLAASAKAQGEVKLPASFEVQPEALFPYQSADGKMFCYYDPSGRIEVGTPFTARGSDGQNVTIDDWNKHAKLTVELSS